MKKIWNWIKAGWMRFAKALGWVNTRILLSVFFVIIVGIYALISKPFRWMKRKKNINSYWQDKDNEKEVDLIDLTHQF
ncbi:hypothetical protein KKG71_07270 [Patescibacteria group bacterium]|nr:hypothetical protein [Patescibacteria group bacterium]